MKIEIIRSGRFHGAKGFNFASLKQALTHQIEKEDFIFFADKLIGLMIAMPHSPTSMWQKSKSTFNKQGGWYETNLIEFGQDFGF